MKRIMPFFLKKKIWIWELNKKILLKKIKHQMNKNNGLELTKKSIHTIPIKSIYHQLKRNLSLRLRGIDDVLLPNNPEFHHFKEDQYQMY